ncbi:hypothetical protein NIES2104_35880 [Leptolyngbya sp. NIES-2104]|nr:hypothetical protein NIES2104_35880 [Leptolyngbya sp. NIES-2104]
MSTNLAIHPPVWLGRSPRQNFKHKQSNELKSDNFTGHL